MVPHDQMHSKKLFHFTHISSENIAVLLAVQNSLWNHNVCDKNCKFENIIKTAYGDMSLDNSFSIHT